MSMSRRRVIALGVVLLLVVAGVVAWVVTTGDDDDDAGRLERAVAMAPEGTARFGWTDWSGVRKKLDADLSASSPTRGRRGVPRRRFRRRPDVDIGPRGVDADPPGAVRVLRRHGRLGALRAERRGRRRTHRPAGVGRLRQGRGRARRDRLSGAERRRRRLDRRPGPAGHAGHGDPGARVPHHRPRPPGDRRERRGRDPRVVARRAARLRPRRQHLRRHRGAGDVLVGVHLHRRLRVCGARDDPGRRRRPRPCCRADQRGRRDQPAPVVRHRQPGERRRPGGDGVRVRGPGAHQRRHPRPAGCRPRARPGRCLPRPVRRWAR